MKKLLKIFGVLILLSIVVLFVLSFFIGSAIKAGAEKLGPEIAQVDIKLDNANVSIFTGSGGIQGLTIGNPKGYTSDFAFNAENISLKLKPSSLLGDKMVFEEILIIGPHIVFERGKNTNNLSEIMSNISDYLGESDSSEPESETESKKIEIRKFVLQDATVDVLGEKPIRLVLPTITLSDLGTGEEGLTGPEVAGKVFKSVIDSTLQEILKNPDTLIEQGTLLFNKFFGGKDEKEDPEN